MSTQNDAIKGDGPTGNPRIGSIYQQLRQDILGLHLRSGESLEEERLAQRFGCKRAAVREALVRLSADGWVELTADRGARVTRIDLAELPRFIEAIDLVSRAINRYAAERRSEGDLAAIDNAARLFDVEAENGDPVTLAEHNRNLHMAVASAADNTYLQETYRHLFDQATRMLHLAFGRARSDHDQQRRHLTRVSADHAKLVGAIRNRDGARAEAVARTHTALFRQRIYDYLNRQTTDEIDVQTDPV